ncbi:hypothetical protein Avbf_11013 [Armadillidium vulgare]|nr:hypothetical protein Avbf_11013 [Armadillidium vulgare]
MRNEKIFITMHVLGFIVSDSQVMEVPLGFLIVFLLICFRKMMIMTFYNLFSCAKNCSKRRV